MVSARYSGQNVSGVKSRNVRAILMNLLYHEPIYRVKLAREINVSTTTVTKLVDEMIVQGILEERHEELDGLRAVGRPQNPIYLNREAYYAVGVHIGGGVYRVGIVNLRNEVLFHRTENYDVKAPANLVLQSIAEQIQNLIRESAISKNRFIGIGVGAPGLVDFHTGEIGYAKNQGWKNVPVASYFRQQLGIPVVVENNVRSMALGETLFGVGKDVNTLLFVYGRLGIGAGIVVDHHIYRGIHSGAGEIGHTYLIQENSALADGYQFRTLEDLIAAPALIKKSADIKNQYSESILPDTLLSMQANDALDSIFESARSGDVQACKLVEENARFLAVALVNAVDVINPELILLGGMFAQGIDLYLPIVRKIVDTMTFAEIGRNVEIRETSFGWRAGLLGAGALALTNFFYLPPGHEIPAVLTSERVLPDTRQL